MIVRSATLTLVLALATGCGLAERAAACKRVAEAATLPTPPKRRTSRADELAKVARAIQAAAKRLETVDSLPEDLAPIAQGLRQQLGAFAQELDSAARARKASHAPEYAAARTRSEEARRALTDLGRRFEQACAR